MGSWAGLRGGLQAGGTALQTTAPSAWALQEALPIARPSRGMQAAPPAHVRQLQDTNSSFSYPVRDPFPAPSIPVRNLGWDSPSSPCYGHTRARDGWAWSIGKDRDGWAGSAGYTWSSCRIQTVPSIILLRDPFPTSTFPVWNLGQDFPSSPCYSHPDAWDGTGMVHWQGPGSAGYRQLQDTNSPFRRPLRDPFRAPSVEFGVGFSFFTLLWLHTCAWDGTGMVRDDWAGSAGPGEAVGTSRLPLWGFSCPRNGVLGSKGVLLRQLDAGRAFVQGAWPRPPILPAPGVVQSAGS